MNTIALGRTGHYVSELCLGTMFFGTKIDQGAAFKVLDAYFEAGGRFLDTANCYSFWAGGIGDESELVLGRWLESRGVRDQIFLATKVGSRPAVPGAPWPEQKEGLSAESILNGIEHSLRRLKTDAVDLLFTHVEDRTIPLEEVLGTLEELVRAGKVRTLGCSNLATWRIAQARTVSRQQGWTEYACAQMRYTYLRPKRGADWGVQVVVSEELIDLCLSDGAFPILAYSPLLQGAYTRSDRALPEAYQTKDSELRLGVLNAVAAEAGCTANQVILAWMRQHTVSMIPIIAASRVEQLSENLGSLSITLTAEQIDRLNAAGE